jgi:quercetin dioxygenase-like cupin family protein
MEFPKWITSLPAEQHEFLSYQLEGKTCDTYFSEVKEGTFIPPHQHDNTVLNFVAEGQITVEQNGKKQTYKPETGAKSQKALPTPSIQTQIPASSNSG